MGVNIIVKKVVEKTMEESWGGKLVPYYKTEKVNWFDTLRYSGDREFIIENEFVYYDNNDTEGEEYLRPKDFNKCREWVMCNVVLGNQNRLLKALDELESDKQLVFRFAW